MYILTIFLSYSFFGFIFETIVSLVTDGKLNSGIMFGPWTPIYGFGVLIMLFLKKQLKKLNLKKYQEIIVFFLSIVVILSLLEQTGGMLLDKVFHKTLWDYSNLKFHITKYIALEISLGWGLGAIIIGYIIHPKLKKYFQKMPFVITAIAALIFSIDAIITFLKYV